MTQPEPTDAGQPEDNQTADTAEIAALVDRLNIPDRSPRPPRTITETCPCCKQPTGTYWVIPRGWEPTEGKGGSHDARPCHRRADEAGS